LFGSIGWKGMRGKGRKNHLMFICLVEMMRGEDKLRILIAYIYLVNEGEENDF
jgi:hypothetical protein